MKRLMLVPLVAVLSTPVLADHINWQGNFAVTPEDTTVMRTMKAYVETDITGDGLPETFTAWNVREYRGADGVYNLPGESGVWTVYSENIYNSYGNITQRAGEVPDHAWPAGWVERIETPWAVPEELSFVFESLNDPPLNEATYIISPPGMPADEGVNVANDDFSSPFINFTSPGGERENLPIVVQLFDYNDGTLIWTSPPMYPGEACGTAHVTPSLEYNLCGNFATVWFKPQGIEGNWKKGRVCHTEACTAPTDVQLW